MFFAATDPSGEAIKQWLLVLGFLVSIAGNVVSLMAFFRKPQKQERDVRLVSDAVSKVEFDRHVKAVTQAVEKMSGETKERFDQIDAESDERRRTIYRMIDTSEKTLSANLMTVREHVAGLEAKTELLNQRVVQIDMKLDRAIERKPR